MGKAINKILNEASKNQSGSSLKSIKTAGLLFQANKTVNQLKARKFLGTTREAAKFSRPVEMKPGLLEALEDGWLIMSGLRR